MSSTSAPLPCRSRVLEQVSHEPAQQRAVADQIHRLAVDGSTALRRLLGGEPEQIDRLSALEGVAGAERFETAREQELADQIVELGDVARDARAKLRALLAAEELDRDTDSRER